LGLISEGMTAANATGLSKKVDFVPAGWAESTLRGNLPAAV
jgi:hypothetical protein